MPKVKIIKQWRGHDVGTTPDLTDERAAELIREGYACPCDDKPPAPPAPPAEEETPKPRRRRRRLSGGDSSDT